MLVLANLALGALFVDNHPLPPTIPSDMHHGTIINSIIIIPRLA
jgi:hypothetical protein